MSAFDVISRMYDAINDRDVVGALACVDDNVLYEDLNFPESMKGIAQVEELFRASCEQIPKGMDFVVDSTTDCPPGCTSVGVTWHVEIGGIPFPNTRGCSLYRIDPDSRKLVYARDVVESALKPGDAAFGLLRVLVPLFLRINGGGKEAEPAGIKEAAGGGPPAAALWALASTYVAWLILSPPNLIAPGEPIWAIRPETLTEVYNESVNFFFVNVALDRAGLSPIPSVPCNPVSEGVFNLVNAWSFMFLPLLLEDARSDGVPGGKYAWWSVQMFLTNAILTPYLALRAGGVKAEGEEARRPGTAFKRSFGIVGGAVGLASVAWVSCARPEFVAAGIEPRAAMLRQLLSEDRVTFAFFVDMVLYSVWAPFLLSEVDPEDTSPFRYVPFINLVRWLLK